MTRSQAHIDISEGINEFLERTIAPGIRHSEYAEVAGQLIASTLKALLKRQLTAFEAEDLLERVERDIWSF